MAIGDIYQLKMKQLYFTQDILNVFYYRQTVEGTPTPSFSTQLFQGFDLNVLSVWQGAFSTSITIPEVEVINLPTPSDSFLGTPANNVGTRAIGDNLRAPSWIAAGFKSNRAGAGTRSSFKRFAGLAEIDIDDNVISPAFITLAAGLQAAMGDIIPTPQASVFEPVQVKSATVIVGFQPVFNFVITDWLAAVLTSQVSRKP